MNFNDFNRYMVEMCSFFFPTRLMRFLNNKSSNNNNIGKRRSITFSNATQHFLFVVVSSMWRLRWQSWSLWEREPYKHQSVMRFSTLIPFLIHMMLLSSLMENYANYRCLFLNFFITIKYIYKPHINTTISKSFGKSLIFKQR